MIAQLLENVKNPVVSNKLSKWLSKKMAITDLHRKLGEMSGLSNWSFYWMLIHILHHIKVVHQSSKKKLLRRFQVPQKMSRKLPFAKWRGKSLNLRVVLCTGADDEKMQTDMVFMKKDAQVTCKVRLVLLCSFFLIFYLFLFLVLVGGDWFFVLRQYKCVRIILSLITLPKSIISGKSKYLFYFLFESHHNCLT